MNFIYDILWLPIAIVVTWGGFFLQVLIGTKWEEFLNNSGIWKKYDREKQQSVGWFFKDSWVGILIYFLPFILLMVLLVSVFGWDDSDNPYDPWE